MEGAVGLIRWFERTESVFSRSNCTEDCKVKFATGTLTEDALSWWDSDAKPIRIEQADKIAWTELKRLLINKYCPRTEVRKMEDEFTIWLKKEMISRLMLEDSKNWQLYVQTWCQIMRNLRKFSSRDCPKALKEPNTTNDNNYHNNHNNDHHQQHNRRQETFRAYAATPTEDHRVLSSPNHPTSDIEDAFSSNFPDYILASLYYVPTSPGKTFSESSNNSSGLVPIASPNLSLFHDNPYMKVMHTYDAIIPPQVPIPPPTIVPPPPMLSPIFNPQEFFVPEELLPPKEQKLVADSVAAALEAQAANMTNTDNTNRNPKPRETHAARKCTYKEFLSCQPFYFKGTEGAVGLIRWKIEDEFYNLIVKGNNLKTYARRFQELATLNLNMVPNNEKLMEVFIGGLPQSIEGTVTASKP
uniref:Reverse transcriptase domain-containing protein n=1 Tax=Tanacetum cinerariifolium TaxID=118510 RepID=A0A6L2JAA4_TANCI|nr:reverse transcriptase domain-containing protein [Tanacetum cinerariifolium]